jgi:hypothetical protein
MRIRSTLIILSAALLAGVLVGCNKEEPENISYCDDFAYSDTGKIFTFLKISSNPLFEPDTSYIITDKIIIKNGKEYVQTIWENWFGIDKYPVDTILMRCKNDTIYFGYEDYYQVRWILNDNEGDSWNIINYNYNDQPIDTLGTRTKTKNNFTLVQSYLGELELDIFEKCWIDWTKSQYCEWETYNEIFGLTHYINGCEGCRNGDIKLYTIEGQK